MILTSMLYIQRHDYTDRFDFIILVIGNLLMYHVINLNDASLFIIYVLVMLNIQLYVMHFSKLNK